MLIIQYRKVLREVVSIMPEYDGGLQSEEVEPIQYEINSVYERAELFEMIAEILDDSTTDSVNQYAKIYHMVKNYQNDLLNLL